MVISGRSPEFINQNIVEAMIDKHGEAVRAIHTKECADFGLWLIETAKTIDTADRAIGDAASQNSNVPVLDRSTSFANCWIACLLTPRLSTGSQDSSSSFVLHGSVRSVPRALSSCSSSLPSPYFLR